jgi:serine/threonine-protein kinase
VTSSPPEVHIAPGTVVLDKYRVSRTIGVGGMGVVVQATHTTLGNEVAIKFLLPQFAVSQDAARRFVREAQAASRIASEHIARVFDTGTSQPFGPYIVMEFLEGNDLSHQVRQKGPLDIETAIDFTVQAALALAEAHSAGIVHRDVKPANLFVVHRADGSPVIKVLDFGISKVAETSGLDVTKTSAVLGSGLYMSPEQMKASKNVDHRTDVYGLAITLYELLTRTQPYTADSFAELAIKVNMEPPTDIRGYRPDVPRELAAVIERGFAKKPEDRFGSMADFAVALSPWANPHTRIKVDALRRLVLRHPRAQSSPSLPPPASFPPPALDGDVRIPPPPSMPTPSSFGMDTFGLSGKKGFGEPLGQTSEKSFASPGKPRRAGPGLLGIGIGVGVLIGIGVVGAFYAGIFDAPAASTTGATPSPTITAEAPQAATTGSSTPRIAPLDTSAAADTTAPQPTSSSATNDVAHPTAPATGRATASAVATATPSSTAPAPTAAAAATWGATSEPPPTATAPSTTPCKLRDIDGTVKDCPK